MNTARDSLIDEAALEKELVMGRFRAILDVFESDRFKAGKPVERAFQCTPDAAYSRPYLYDRRKFVTLNLVKDMKRFFYGTEMEYEISKEYAKYMTR